MQGALRRCADAEVGTTFGDACRVRAPAVLAFRKQITVAALLRPEMFVPALNDRPATLGARWTVSAASQRSWSMAVERSGQEARAHASR